MSLVSKVAAVTGASTADVLRVAREGGTTAEDWAIAHAIEAVGGRPAYELMLTAGRDQMIAEIWADSRDPEPITPAKEEQSTFDLEDTDEDQAQDEADTPGAREWQELMQTRIWPDVARATGAPKQVVDRIVAEWTTARAALKGVKALLVTEARHRPKVRRVLATYACAA